MAFTEGSNDGALNGTTAVTIVAAPAASTRRLVKTITIHNCDTAEVTVTLQFVNDASIRKLGKFTVGVDETLIWNDPLILDATTKSIKAVMSGAPATTQPDFTSHYGDVA